MKPRKPPCHSSNPLHQSRQRDKKRDCPEQKSITLPNFLDQPKIYGLLKLFVALGLISVCLGQTGCGTTTNKKATEQLLMSDAVDTAIAKIDFRYLEGRKVFLDTSYIKSVKSVGFVNSEYIISSLRQQMAAARCLIQTKKEDADIIIEPRVGALGTDGHELTYGIPQTNALASAAAVFTNSPIAPAVPEISLGRNVAQSGIAKIIVFAYEQESKLPVWQSGIAKSESTSSSTWWLGAGPFQKGSIYKGFRFAGKRIRPDGQTIEPNSNFDRVVYDAPHVFEAINNRPIEENFAGPLPPESEVGNVQQASHEEKK